jgi:hypothetical protein
VETDVETVEEIAAITLGGEGDDVVVVTASNEVEPGSGVITRDGRVGSVVGSSNLRVGTAVGMASPDAIASSRGCQA